ncbi:hypothetical protein BGX27_001338 [Mortierella sp. AM989]|nr:hypothetical protein BGX27_001338 [Mortierella sp. AM989]
MATTFEQDQQLFADTILKLQIHSALAKENLRNNKSPIPLLAQSCSLLDNFPTRPQSSYWIPAQEALINSLKLDAWLALADACIQAKDLIQAEASLQRLSSLQEAAAGPLSLRSKANKNSRSRNRHTENTSINTTITIPGLAHASNNSSYSLLPTQSSPPPEALAGTPDVGATIEQHQAATDLVKTWEKLCQVYSDMGKQEMSNNFAKRAGKMRERLKGPSSDLN